MSEESRNWTKIGRNDACPCRSGKKYKKCCLPIHEARQREAPASPGAFDEIDDLDQLSNAAHRLIASGALEAAEAIAHDLLRRYPDQIDGIERLGEIYEARGESAKAAEQYRKAAAFTLSADGFDPEVTDMFRERAVRLDRATVIDSGPRAVTKPEP